MTDQPSSLSRRAEARAATKARRAKRIERQEAFLDLVASSYSFRLIATAIHSPRRKLHNLTPNTLKSPARDSFSARDRMLPRARTHKIGGPRAAEHPWSMRDPSGDGRAQLHSRCGAKVRSFSNVRPGGGGRRVAV